MAKQFKDQVQSVTSKVRDMSGKVKIKTDHDLAALDKQVYDELGIELQKYRNPEIAATVADLILFPKYVIQWVGLPLVLSLLLYFIGFFVFDYSIVSFLVYLLLGLVLFALSGLLGGCVYLITRLRSDLIGILRFSFDIMEDALQDLKVMRYRLNWANRGRAMRLLFKGVIYVVTIPTITGAIGRKIPVFGKLVKWLLRWLLTKLANLIKFDFGKADSEGNNEEPVPDNKLLPYLKAVRKAVEQVSNFIGALIGVVRFPFLLAFSFVFSLLLLTLYLIW